MAMLHESKTSAGEHGAHTRQPTSDVHHDQEQSGGTHGSGRGMMGMALEVERAHLQPAPGAADALPNVFPRSITWGLLAGIFAGALIGLGVGALLFDHVVVGPRIEQLYSDGRITFYTFWMLMGIAAGIVIGGAGTILAARPAPHPDAEPAHSGPATVTVGPALYAVVALTVADGLIHFWVTPHHFEEYGTIAGLAIAGSGLAQFAVGGMLLARHTQRWISINIVLTVALLVIWAYTRTVGLPFDEPLHVEPTDTVSKAVEILLLGGLIWLARPQALSERH